MHKFFGMTLIISSIVFFIAYLTGCESGSSVEWVIKESAIKYID